MTYNEFKLVQENDIVIYEYDNRYDFTQYKQYKVLEKDDEYLFFSIESDNNIIEIIHYGNVITLKEYEILHRLDKIKKII